MKRNILLLIISTLLSFCIAEFVLRKAGWKPSVFQRNQWITFVEKLERIRGFTSDQHGIFKVDTAVVNHLRTELDVGNIPVSEVTNYSRANLLSLEIAAVFENHRIAKNQTSRMWEYASRIKQIGAENSLDSSIQYWFENPFNEDGFYSIPFDSSVQSRAKVLLLGDSFTWGHSTTNKVNSFANTLGASGFAIFNTGISGADLPQYNAVLRKYFTKLKPDIVIVNLFMGNDIVAIERKVEPYVPIHFSTNAGNLLSFQAGHQFRSMEAAYEKILGNMVIPQSTALNKWMSKTVVTTLAWAVLVNYGLIDYEFTEPPYNPEIEESRNELLKLKLFCEEQNVPLVISIIPEYLGGKLLGSDKYPTVFANISYTEFGFDESMYVTSDGHFNNKGHAYYAKMLNQLILKRLKLEPESE